MAGRRQTYFPKLRTYASVDWQRWQVAGKNCLNVVFLCLVCFGLPVAFYPGHELCWQETFLYKLRGKRWVGRPRLQSAHAAWQSAEQAKVLGKMLRCNVLAFDGGFWKLAFLA